MEYTVIIDEHEGRLAVSVPRLPGCHSQGETEEVALDNIKVAIREYLEVANELAQSFKIEP